MLNSWNKRTRRRNMSWGTLHYVTRITNEHLIKSHPKDTLASFPTTPQISGFQRIKWSQSEWRNLAQWPWFTSIGIMWKAWKISFLILVNSSCVSAGASTISRKIANGSEKLELVSIEVPSSSHFFPVQISKSKIKTNRKWDVIHFCLEITWEWASSIYNSIGMTFTLLEWSPVRLWSISSSSEDWSSSIMFVGLFDTLECTDDCATERGTSRGGVFWFKIKYI